jgi:hypothetical protein
MVGTLLQVAVVWFALIQALTLLSNVAANFYLMYWAP